MSVFLSILPIALLIFLMVKKNPWPSFAALPFCAALLYFIKLIYFKSSPEIVNATVIKGFIAAYTPILVIFGAILLFKVMRNTGGLEVISRWLNSIADNKVAQLMIIGWCFVFIIEGASGFGVPAALAAPVLVGLGFKPVRAAVLCLIMDSFPVSFGTVGIPTWFGLGQLGLTHQELLQAGFYTAVVNGVAALVVPVIALMFLVSLKEIKKNLIFIYLSILSCIVPFVIIAKFSYEFPTIIGGLIGFSITIFLAKKRIGLSDAGEPVRRKDNNEVPFKTLAKYSFPLWGSILILIITRIQQFGFYDMLTSTKTWVSVQLGNFCHLIISDSLILTAKNIFNTHLAESLKLLFIPSIFPFLIFAVLGILILKRGDMKLIKSTFYESLLQIKLPIITLMAALVFVDLMMIGGDNACTNIIGRSLANLVGDYWSYCAAFLGAIGAFFSGSNTVSNLMFGGIQMSIAQQLNLSQNAVLALQSAGGAFGNMVCINNIVAVCVVLGLTKAEGKIIKKTFIPMFVYGIIAAVVAFFIT
ncbi:MAG: L-lactate permease [Victivallales bacterium]|nr:L-lactate permease [Victivallales bacterium]